MKVGIVGAAGCLGSTAAFSIATQGLADELVLVDTNENLVQAHVIDIREAVVAAGHDMAIRVGSYEDMAGADIVIVAAAVDTVTARFSRLAASGVDALSQPVRPSRQQLIASNMRVIPDIARAAGRVCPDAVVITCTNPVEALSYASYLLSPTQDRMKFIGYSINDSFRFRRWVAEAVGVEPSKVKGIVIGEHGDSQVPLFSSIRVDGQPVSLTEPVKQELRKKAPESIRHWLGLKPGRSSGWLSGAGLATMVKAVRDDTGEMFPCSVVMAGEYGYQGFSMTVPVILGRQGVHQVLEWELAPDEKKWLEQSASVLKAAARLVEEILALE